MNGSRLVRLGMDVLGYGCIAVGCASRRLPILKQLQTSFDVYVGWVQVSSTLVSIECVGCLVVAGLVLCHC